MLSAMLTRLEQFWRVLCSPVVARCSRCGRESDDLVVVCGGGMGTDDYHCQACREATRQHRGNIR